MSNYIELNEVEDELLLDEDTLNDDEDVQSALSFTSSSSTTDDVGEPSSPCSSPSSSSASSSSTLTAVNPCWICIGEVEEADQFRPCNCRYTFVHRQCLKTWIAYSASNERCGLCKIIYDANRIDEHCAVCKQNIEEPGRVADSSFCSCCVSGNYSSSPERPPLPLILRGTAVCRCEFIAMHSACLRDAYEHGVHQCPFCRAEYERLLFPVRYRRLLACWRALRCTVVFLFVVALFAFLIGGQMLINECINGVAAFTGGGGKMVHIRYFLVNGRDEGSILLFPGVGRSTIVLDVVYFALFVVFCVVGSIVASVYEVNARARRRRRLQGFQPDERHRCHSLCGCLCRKDVHSTHIRLLIAAAVCLLTHLLGNLHYAFYWLVGVLPHENLFWLFDLRSFMAGCFVLLQGFLFWACCYALLYRRLCGRPRRAPIHV